MQNAGKPWPPLGTVRDISYELPPWFDKKYHMMRLQAALVRGLLMAGRLKVSPTGDLQVFKAAVRAAIRPQEDPSTVGFTPRTIGLSRWADMNMGKYPQSLVHRVK